MEVNRTMAESATPTTKTTKEGFSSLDTLAVARELRAIGRAWFDKAYELPGQRLLVTLKVQGQGRWELMVAPGKFALVRPSTTERPDEPGRLGTEVRRQLTGAPLLSVQQPEGERYLELSFGRGGEEEPAILALELFGQGNVLVVRRGHIAALLHAKVWAGRRLRAGEPYLRPPARKDPFQLTPGEVLGVLSRSKTDRVSTLAARLGLGGPVAEELLVRAGLDPRAPATEGAESASDLLVASMRELASSVEDPPKGFLYRSVEDGKARDATPYPSRRWTGVASVREEPLARFSEAAQAYFPELAPPPPSAVPTPTDLRQDKRESLLRLQAQQTAAAEELERAMGEDQGAAETLLSHYAEAEELVEKARGQSPDEVEVEIQLEGRTFRIAAWRPLRESAQGLFEEAKRRLPKLEGARRALADTESRLRALEAERSAEVRAQAEKVRKASEGAPQAWRGERKKHFWFEKAPRWMISSQGLVAVSGRDARSNDAIVKRYLKERDTYIHADLQGAPSVVIKRPAPGQGEVDDASVREIAQWAASCSKAWRAGLASADAFWVAGDQVSKAGASGEFVARGSWVIHGTKHFERDLPLELALGTVVHEGETLLQVAPPASLAGQGRKVLWRILPGDDRDREKVEREVAQDLGISRERLQALLPPGGVRAVRP